MTTLHFLADLMMDEGFRSRPYNDTLGNITIGYGHKDNTLPAGTVWTKTEALEALREDVAAVKNQLDVALPWWRGLDPPRQDVIANMAFNLGVHGLEQFVQFLALVRDGHYAQAAEDMLGTKWAKQVPSRAQRLAELMRG